MPSLRSTSRHLNSNRQSTRKPLRDRPPSTSRAVHSSHPIPPPPFALDVYQGCLDEVMIAELYHQHPHVLLQLQKASLKVRTQMENDPGIWEHALVGAGLIGKLGDVFGNPDGVEMIWSTECQICGGASAPILAIYGLDISLCNDCGKVNFYTVAEAQLKYPYLPRRFLRSLAFVALSACARSLNAMTSLRFGNPYPKRNGVTTPRVSFSVCSLFARTSYIDLRSARVSRSLILLPLVGPSDRPISPKTYCVQHEPRPPLEEVLEFANHSNPT